MPQDEVLLHGPRLCAEGDAVTLFHETHYCYYLMTVMCLYFIPSIFYPI